MIADSLHLPLKDQSVNCIITSPPYWSLRKYDIPDLIWDGDNGCEHGWGNNITNPKADYRTKEDMISQGATVGNTINQELFNPKNMGQFCLHCSAWSGQLGLEPTIDLYLRHLMQIMDECKRVLRDDGTMWVNLGDSYNGSGQDSSKSNRQFSQSICGSSRMVGEASPTSRTFDKLIKAKSLCLIPYRFAIEMVDRGWILRNIIIWHKPNCMPASVKDRFTVDFEPVFFFVKSRKYWFESQYDELADCTKRDKRVVTGYKTDGRVWDKDPNSMFGKMGSMKVNPQGRNRRCIWTISTQPYPESHFATFPEALVEPMIRAGCPKEICVKCGKAREKIMDVVQGEPDEIYIGQAQKDYGSAKAQNPSDTKRRILQSMAKKKIEIGLTDCGCNAGFRPGIVLDPFCGSGTTMRVAEKLNRIGIGFDLAYEELQGKRMSNIQKELLA